LISPILSAHTVAFDNGMQFDINGYAGWKQIVSNVEFDSVPPEPELGLTTSIKLNDRWTIFTQLVYGRKIDKIFAYNQLSYTPPTPIDDLVITIKGGRVLHNTFLYNATRIDPRTRQGVIQPQAMSWDTLNRATTSGDGIGADVKYKNMSISFVADKMVIVDPTSQAQNWSNNPTMRDLRTNFDNRIITLDYEIPEYDIRTKIWAEKNHFTIADPMHNNYKLGGEHLGAGIEWKPSPFVLSTEGFCTKIDRARWTHWNTLYCGMSGTIEYDLTENWTIRGNYNQYITTADPTAINVAKNSKDLNTGVNWHHKNWVAGIEAHYIRGGRLVNTESVYNNPKDYERFYVIGMNVVYFFD